jgi:hypothetical protein
VHAWGAVAAYQRVASHTRALLVARRRRLQVAPQQIARRIAHAPLDDGALLRLVERLQLEREKVRLVAHALEAGGARRDEQAVPLRCEHLGDVPLDGCTLAPALVDAVEQQERAARVHRAAQHAVDVGVGAVHTLQVRVDPVPRGGEDVAVLVEEQQPLQLLHAHKDRHQLPAVEHLRHKLRHEARLARRRRPGEQHAPTLLRVPVAPRRVHSEQLGGERTHVAKVLGVLALPGAHDERHELLTHVEALA